MKSEIETSFASTIGRLLELSEAAFGEHERWNFYRHLLLKHLNRLKRDVLEELSRGGEETHAE